MAQLIKLLDYPSRYELDIYHYPAQFIRLKRWQWHKLKVAWETGTLHVLQDIEYEEAVLVEKEQQGLLSRLLQKFKRKSEVEEIEVDYDLLEKTEIAELFQEIGEIDSIEVLKEYFLNQIFQFQIRWASSRFGITEEERKSLYYDGVLQYFLHSFSDNIMLFYKPIFFLGKAPVELEVIFVTPLETLCISCIDEAYNAVYVGTKEYFWNVKGIPVERSILNPNLAVNRMEKIIRQLYHYEGIDMPIKKIVMAKSGYIDYINAPMDTLFIDKRTINKWAKEIKSTNIPIKHTQLKAVNALIKMCDVQLAVDEVEFEEDR